MHTCLRCRRELMKSTRDAFCLRCLYALDSRGFDGDDDDDKTQPGKKPAPLAIAA